MRNFSHLREKNYEKKDNNFLENYGLLILKKRIQNKKQVERNLNLKVMNCIKIAREINTETHSKTVLILLKDLAKRKLLRAII